MSKVAKVVSAIVLFALAPYVAPFFYGTTVVAKMLALGNFALRTRDSKGREWIMVGARLR